MALDLLYHYTTEPPRCEYVIPGMMPGTVGSLVSPGGSGKSFWALQLAHQVACGKNLLGFPDDTWVKGGRVAYLSVEDSTAVLWERLYSLGARLSPEERDMCAERIVLEDLTPHNPDLSDGIWRAAIERLAKDMTLVILDTLRMFHSKDENSSEHMSVIMGILRAIAAKTGASILYLHHSNKNLPLTGNGDLQQASRGSSVLTDNIRWQGFVLGMSKEEAAKLSDNGRTVIGDRRGLFARFGISKQNYGPPIPERWYRRTEGGVLVPVELVEIGKGGQHRGY